jgi:[acyl-carrier-protein] S-malonyltransferase
MVFPGQGSQSLGMQADLADAWTEVRSTYAQASEALGFDLWDLVQNGPAEKLDETVITQPAMLTAGIAAWRCWQAAGGGQPQHLAGHSLGEYTALVVAGSLKFEDAVLLVRRRAELMQEAVPAGSGAMAAILGLDDEKVLEVCEDASGIGVAEAVNFNSPSQVVIAGHRSAVERVIVLAEEQGARRAIMLHVSVPSHSSLMRPAGDALAESLAATEFQIPAIEVLNSVDGSPYQGPDDIRERLRKQVFSPVRWVRTVQQMITDGASSLVECGPGKVLTGLAKRIDRSVPAACTDSPEALARALAAVNGAATTN